MKRFDMCLMFGLGMSCRFIEELRNKNNTICTQWTEGKISDKSQIMIVVDINYVQ